MGRDGGDGGQWDTVLVDCWRKGCCLAGGTISQLVGVDSGP